MKGNRLISRTARRAKPSTATKGVPEAGEPVPWRRAALETGAGIRTPSSRRTVLSVAAAAASGRRSNGQPKRIVNCEPPAGRRGGSMGPRGHILIKRDARQARPASSRGLAGADAGVDVGADVYSYVRAPRAGPVVAPRPISGMATSGVGLLCPFVRLRTVCCRWRLTRNGFMDRIER